MDIINGLKAGADDYITKPYDPDELHMRTQVGERIIRLQNARIHNEKIQGVLEMAGAVCHELNQPLQTISTYSELTLLKMSENDPFYRNIKVINEHIEKIGKITRKLMSITKYETYEYLQGQKIIDIDKSST